MGGLSDCCFVVISVAIFGLQIGNTPFWRERAFLKMWGNSLEFLMVFLKIKENPPGKVIQVGF